MRGPVTFAALMLSTLLVGGCADGSISETEVSTGEHSIATTSTPTSMVSPTTTMDEEPNPLIIDGPYVALGSSYAAGIAAGDTLAGTCARGSRNYARIVAEALNVELIDASCAGATVDNVVSTPQDGNPPQIDSVVEEASLVTVTVGGNDVGYVQTYFKCAAACPKSVLSEPAELDSRFAELTAELVAMLNLITAKAPEAEVVLVSYPVILESETDVCDGVRADDAAFLYGLGVRLEQSFVDAAAQTGVTFVDVYAASIGHGACRDDATRWMESNVNVSPGGLPWHPNAASHEAQAELILEALNAR